MLEKCLFLSCVCFLGGDMKLANPGRTVIKIVASSRFDVIKSFLKEFLDRYLYHDNSRILEIIPPIF